MDNYQMFFPPFSPTMPTTNQVYNNTTNFHESSSNGLLMRLKNNTSVERSSELVKEEHDIVSRSSGVTFSGDDDNDLVGKSSGKKKEKKMKKPRYAFQTRSRVDILDDGYRWRKYGQKAVKNNKFPRSYYRCTHQGCSVKKQVQRLTKDETIVVTTYEGMHTHPIERPSDNFEQILSQMQFGPPF